MNISLLPTWSDHTSYSAKEGILEWYKIMLGMHNTCDQVIVLLLLGTLFVHRESEGIVTGCLFLPPTVCKHGSGARQHDCPCEFGACHTVCVSSYHARITRWFNEYCTIILCLFSISFFQQSCDLETQVSLMKYVAIFLWGPLCTTIQYTNYVWHFISKLLRNWFCFSSLIRTYQSATYYVLLVSMAIIANITKQHSSVLNNTTSADSITRTVDTNAITVWEFEAKFQHC